MYGTAFSHPWFYSDNYWDMVNLGSFNLADRGPIKYYGADENTVSVLCFRGLLHVYRHGPFRQSRIVAVIGKEAVGDFSNTLVPFDGAPRFLSSASYLPIPAHGANVFAHSIGALVTFHQGSQLAAYESTAKQTEQLLAFRFGAGLYVNYLFVIVWLADAAIRLLLPKRYLFFPKWYRYGVIGFLVFIAINGSIVFQAGWTRYVGIGCLLFLGALAWAKRNSGFATSLPFN